MQQRRHATNAGVQLTICKQCPAGQHHPYHQNVRIATCSMSQCQVCCSSEAVHACRCSAAFELIDLQSQSLGIADASSSYKPVAAMHVHVQTCTSPSQAARLLAW